MIHYPDLAESKGVVLMVGEYDKDVLVSCLFQSLIFIGLTLSLLEFKLDPIFFIYYCLSNSSRVKQR